MRMTIYGVDVGDGGDDDFDRDVCVDDDADDDEGDDDDCFILMIMRGRC